MRNIPVCEECRAEDPDTGVERGHDSSSGLPWKREYSQCCDSDVIMVTKDDVEDEAFKDHPDLIEFGYHPETLDAKADLVIKSDAQFNSLISYLKNKMNKWKVTVTHPDSNTESQLSEPMVNPFLYDWISGMLEDRVDYSSSHLTVYRLTLDPNKKMITIYWEL